MTILRRGTAVMSRKLAGRPCIQPQSRTSATGLAPKSGRLRKASTRAAASSGIFSPVIAAGFARWADVLERYHASKWGVG